ncbi:MAG: single-stranded-DNA-specific exonuclease RecJ [Brevinematales bacterium]|nr:single-stranded-DNA-specific exonuclease RecJ [Brevinematales bacterium]
MGEINGILKKWHINDIDFRILKDFKDYFQYPELIIKSLLSRGIDSREKVLNYTNGSFLALYSPFYFKDMEKAISRIMNAIQNKEVILIFGDRDVDGVSATAIVYRFLDKLVDDKSKLIYRVPEGQDNYGLTREVIDWAALNEVNLIITVDCGITTVEEIEKAKKLGIDVIVTDHHEPRDVLPDAVAIINPKVKSDNYPFSFLSGSSVALKLVLGLAERLYLKDYHNEEIVFLDLETTGLNPFKDEIIEIGAIIVKNGIVIDRFEALVKPENPISSEIETLTNISNEMLNRQGKPIDLVMAKFLEFIGTRKLVGHNLIEFDLKFIETYLRKKGLPQIKNQLEDTLKMARIMLKNCKDHKLNTVANFLGLYVDTTKLHRSIADSEVCAEVYRRLIVMRNQRYVELIEENISYAAIGTIADIMPLIGENRIIVKNGVKYLKRAPVGLLTLIRELKLDFERVKARDLSFYVSPVLNSPGRLGDASLSVELLISSKINEAEDLVVDIIKKNGERKNVVDNSIEDIEDMIEKEDIEGKKILVFCSEKFTKGTIGLIASKFCNLYSMPVVVIAIDGDLAIGSVRATNGFDVPMFLESLEHHFTQFGGHTYAGGFVARSDKLAEIKKSIENYEFDTYEEKNYIDFEINDLGEFNLNNMRYLDNVLQPVGYKNQMPLILFRNVKVIDFKSIGKKQEHVLFKIEKDGKTLNVVGWNFSEKLKEAIFEGIEINLVARPEINVYNNEEEVRLIFVDIIKE